MSAELAQIIIRHAPLRNANYAVLLHLAWLSDSRDFVNASVPTIARGLRASEWRTRKTLRALEAAGYITRFRWGNQRDPQTGRYYYLNREVVFGCPVVTRKKLAKRLPSESRSVVLARVETVQAFLLQEEGKKRLFLEGLAQR